MSRAFNVAVCEDNRNIVRDNGYRLNGKFVELPCSLTEHQKVEVLSLEKIKSIVEDEDEFFERSFWGSSECCISVVNEDSFAHPSDLVMNFANAIRPGGGYKSGASAQEEALCRQSTLYASIGSADAREMYEHNRLLNAPFDSDYMLLSPNVDVFRNADLNLLDEPYTTAVMTIPAPNLNGRASGQPQKTVAFVMRERIRQYLYCAARYGYRTITLGAWGCGAFGHDAKEVARYFHDLLVGEKMWQFFDAILFAIYDKTADQYNYRAFKEAFSDVEAEEKEAISWEELDEFPTYYIRAEKRFPICNHTQEIDASNLGFCQGIVSDGNPFEAELWENEEEKALTVILPELEIPVQKTNSLGESSNVVGFKTDYPYEDGSVLWIGMVNNGQEHDDEIVQFYVDYLKESGLIEFAGDMENGAVIYCTDIAGSNLVNVTIALEEKGHILAETDLKFTPFFGSEKKGKIIKMNNGSNIYGQ